MDPERQSLIQAQLQTEIDHARERLAAAHLAFRFAIRDLPDEIRSAEDIPGLEEIAIEQRTALAHLNGVLERYSDFVLRGVVPIDLSR